MSAASDSNGQSPHDRRVLAVSSIPLLDGIGVTLVRDVAGWRFQTWHTHDNSAVRPDPNVEDRALYFESADEAAEYFKQQYGRKLRNG